MRRKALKFELHVVALIQTEPMAKQVSPFYNKGGKMS